ncbi:MAG TPA: DUF4097 family beta strand repeat-containing protein [Balneolaceae bacterium]
MKTLKLILPILIAALLLPLQTKAQEQIAVPLTNPGEPGQLNVNVIHGSVTVTGYDGNEVLISYSGGDNEDQQKVTEEGLRRISSNSVGFQVSEDNNEVTISGVSPMQPVDFEISVPQNFSLNLSAVNGELLVKNVSGEMELSSVNGEINLLGVNGSALVNTVNGDITAVFDEVPPNAPMAFTNLNGDIDVTLPADVQMTAKMKSEWGEVFTDFEMNINRASENPELSTENGVYKVSVNNWIYGTVNGGGPEYLFKSMRGDIYIRKK